MDKRSFIATLCVCGTVVVSAVLFSHAGAPQAIPQNETPIEVQGGPICPCPGDANCDGVVNFMDITTVLANWNRVCCPPGMACDDGNPCTIGDTCVTGQGCIGFPISCDDFDPCTEDYCCQGICIHVPIDCCAGVTCNDNDPCTTDSCDPMTGNCVFTPIPGCGGCASHADCDDGLFCTIDQCVGGMCQHTPMNCADMNPCTEDTCDEAMDICVHTPLPGCGPCTNSMQCNDNNPCTNDFCDGMSMMCVHLPIPGCGPCTTAVQCDDGMPCTIDTCVMNICQHTPAPDGTACNDGNLCTIGDVCVNGMCTPGAPINCNDGDPCTNDVCDAMSGMCFHQPIPGCCQSAAQCDDGNACTIDTCEGNVCQHVQIVCNDNNTCTFDNCDPAVGCVFIPIPFGQPCDDGNPCTVEDRCDGNGNCIGIPINCDDGNACTNDFCSNGVCIHSTVPNGTGCTDGNGCTQFDTCQNGVCVGGPPVMCPPGSFCNPATGGCEIPNP